MYLPILAPPNNTKTCLIKSFGILGKRSMWHTVLRKLNSHLRTIPWRRAWQPTPGFLPGESHGQKSLAPMVNRVTKSQTQLKRLSSSTALRGNFSALVFLFTLLYNVIFFTHCFIPFEIQLKHLKILIIDSMCFLGILNFFLLKNNFFLMCLFLEFSSV